MKANDLKISTQMRLGQGVILLLVLLLASVAWQQTDRLWEQTQGLYEHPFAVSRALGQLEVAEKTMSLRVRDLFLAKSDAEIEAAVQGIEVARSATLPLLAVLRDRYLGPPADVVALEAEFARWTALRDETIRLVRAGRTADAEARVGPDGIQTAQATAVHGRLLTIEDFARDKADSFYQTAVAQRDALNRRLGIITAAILILTLSVSWLLLQRIRRPLKELKTVSEQFRKGRLDARSRYVSGNEFGTLSDAFNTMADAIETQMRIGERETQLADVMLREEEVGAFCHELLKALLQHTGSQVGAIYFLNETKSAFEHIDSIGLGAGGRRAFPAVDLEGELGATLAMRTIQRITDIPADSRFTFAAVSGEFVPREIISIPVLSDGTVVAIISLASVDAYDASAVQLVNDIWSVLSARVNGVLMFRTLKALAGRLEIKNRELDEQKRELSLQAGELTEQNMELEMQKRQLDEASRLKSAFLSNMSHELRTPLNSVIALSGVLNRRLAKVIPDEEYDYLEIIERNSRNLLALINDILDLSRIEAGYEEISAVHFSVRELVDETVAMIEPLAREKKIELENRVGDNLPRLVSDPVKFRQILQNLLGNAVKFTEQGEVAISARTDGRELYVSVTDTGIGIAADQIPYIFDEFRQADGSTSRKYGGTGLGLAIARKYARLLGGGLSVESSPGKGSVFTLRLPLTPGQPGTTQADATADQPMPSHAAVPTTGRPAGGNILVVEDNEPAIIQLTDILEAEGYLVQVARNGKEALERIGQLLPDAMILDLMMPEVDGFEVLKAIRGEAPTSQLPVLILTAKHVTRDELSFLKGNHIQQLIQKGDINREGLLKAVARMVTPDRTTAAARAPDPFPATERPPRPERPLVLIVEDNPDSRRTAVALLKERCRIVEADDGRSGIEQAREHRPDLILMDIAMPVMDGIQALKEIRRDPALRHIPVIAVTASAMKGDQETILAHGFDGYLSKQIDAALLIKTLTEALD
jgi:signal transduction histidine kinase/CheY-like chemotaxis protein